MGGEIELDIERLDGIRGCRVGEGEALEGVEGDVGVGDGQAKVVFRGVQDEIPLKYALVDTQLNFKSWVRCRLWIDSLRGDPDIDIRYCYPRWRRICSRIAIDWGPGTSSFVVCVPQSRECLARCERFFICYKSGIRCSEMKHWLAAEKGARRMLLMFRKRSEII